MYSFMSTTIQSQKSSEKAKEKQIQCFCSHNTVSAFLLTHCRIVLLSRLHIMVFVIFTFLFVTFMISHHKADYGKAGVMPIMLCHKLSAGKR